MPFRRDHAGEPHKGAGDLRGFPAGNQERGRRGLGLDHSDKPQRQAVVKQEVKETTARDTHGFPAGNQDDNKRGRGQSRTNRYARDDE